MNFMEKIMDQNEHQPLFLVFFVYFQLKMLLTVIYSVIVQNNPSKINEVFYNLYFCRKNIFLK